MQHSEQDKLAALRPKRLPLWSRIVGSIRAARHRRQEARKFKYIATLKHWTWWVDTKYHSTSWFILQEDGYGKRKFEYGSESCLLQDHKCCGLYATVVAWMSGCYTNEQIREIAAGQRTPARPE